MIPDRPGARTLQLLAVGHYVLAGLLTLAAVPMALLGAGFFVRVAQHFLHGRATSLMKVGAVGAAGGFVVAGLLLALVFFIAGQNLGRGRRYSFCMIAAALMCMIFPLGTLLGIYTISVLLRPDVKPLFS